MVFGTICAVLAAALTIAIFHDAVGEGWSEYPAYAGAAAAITAMSLWWFFVERRQHFSVRRGVFVGASTGVLAHYPCWYFVILGQNVAFWLLGGSGSSLGEPPVDPLNGLWTALVFCFWSWLLIGWLTAIIGSVAGGLYAWRVKPRVSLS